MGLPTRAGAGVPRRPALVKLLVAFQVPTQVVTAGPRRMARRTGRRPTGLRPFRPRVEAGRLEMALVEGVSETVAACPVDRASRPVEEKGQTPVVVHVPIVQPRPSHRHTS